MDKKLTKESWINLITAVILGGFLMYLSKSFGELITAFQVFPLLVMYINDGWKMTLLAWVGTVALGLLFVDPITLAYLDLFMLLGTLFAGYRIVNKKKLGNTILYTAFIKLLLFGGLMAVAFYMEGKNPIEIARGLMYESVDKMADTLNKGLEMTPKEVETYLETARELVDKGIELIPAIMFIASYLSSAINIFLALKVAKASGKDLGYVTKVNEYGATKDLKIASVVVGVICLIAFVLNLEYSEMFVWNLLYVMFFFYLINGFLLIDRMYEKSGRKIMRVLVPVLLLLFLRSLFVYVVVGFIDMLFNIRERMLTGGKKK